MLLALALANFPLSSLLFGTAQNDVLPLLAIALLSNLLLRFMFLTLRMQERGTAYSVLQILSKFFFLVALAIGVAWRTESALTILIFGFTGSLALCAVISLGLGNIPKIPLREHTADNPPLYVSLRGPLGFRGSRILGYDVCGQGFSKVSIHIQ